MSSLGHEGIVLDRSSASPDPDRNRRAAADPQPVLRFEHRGDRRLSATTQYGILHHEYGSTARAIVRGCGLPRDRCGAAYLSARWPRVSLRTPANARDPRLRRAPSAWGPRVELKEHR